MALEAERRAHAELGPSGAHRWTACPGAPNAERGRPDKTTIYAALGTVYHEVISECLEFGLRPENYFGVHFNVGGHEIIFDESFAKYMRPAIDRIEELAAGGDLYIETRVDISRFTLPGQFGTTDIGIIRLQDLEIIIWDHKYGEGVAVSPVENEQAELYCLGFWNDIAERLFTGFDPSDIKVRIIIDQPRARIHIPDEDDEEEEEESESAEDDFEAEEAPVGGGEWVTTMAHLLERGEWFRERALATVPEDAPRIPGPKQCTFCKAKAHCRERTEYHLELVRMSMDDVDEMVDLGAKLQKVPVAPRLDLTPEQRVFIAEHRRTFTNWLREVYESVLDDYLQGYPTPGVKAIRGRRGPRRWLNNQEAEQALLQIESLDPDKLYESKLVSPTKAQALMPVEDFATLKDKITQSEGKATLVSEKDPRIAIVPIRDQFDDISQG